VVMSSLLSSIAATTSHWDREELDRAIVSMLLRHLDAHSVTLIRLLEDGGMRRVAHSIAAGCESTELTAPTSGETTEQPILTDVTEWQECVTKNDIVRIKSPAGLRITQFPIPGERRVGGILGIERAVELSQRDTDLVRDILQIISNHRALLDYGELDTLTGLLNRKTFESHFYKMRQRQPGAGEPSAREVSWIALMDIDHFKSINDRHGHLFGDEVLLLVSRLMKLTFRGADQLIRFGGEEFLIMLHQATEDGARVAFERLRATVEAYEFPQVGRVTVSIGYTRVGRQDMPITCVERADAALYYAKENGRNNVRCFEVLVAAGHLTAKPGSGEIEIF
jgi:diguanylate cyclase (GGDEF)-like protein